MNDKALVAMFLFAALDRIPEAQAAYDNCGMGAVEAARALEDIVEDMLHVFDPERPFCDLLYTDCDAVAEALYKFMREQAFMPTSLNALEL